jgi:membrane protein
MSVGAETLRLCRMRPDIFARIWQRIQADDCFDLAAQVSFYFILSLFPFCLVLAAIAGWLPSTTIWKSFAAWMVNYLPAESQHLVFTTILSLSSVSKGFLSLGLITAIWSASSGFVGLMESLSVAYGAKDTRSYWRKHAIAACVTILAAAFALASFGVMMFGRWGSMHIAAHVKIWTLTRVLWELGRWTFTLILMCLGIDLINFLLPDVRRPWRWITPGTAFVVVTLVGSSVGFNIYIRHFSSYPYLYGTLGGFIILMLWVYLASLILLVGAETDNQLEKLAREVGAA